MNDILEQIAVDYINSKEWEDGNKPTIDEVILNMDEPKELMREIGYSEDRITEIMKELED